MISGPRSGWPRSGAAAGCGCRAVLGQAELQQVARRHRILAPDHHDLPEHVFERGRRVPVQCGLAAQDAPEEPAGTVDADEARRPVAVRAVRAAGGKLGDEFGAEAALDLLDLAALAADGLADLLADFVPEAFGAGRGKRLQLQA